MFNCGFSGIRATLTHVQLRSLRLGIATIPNQPPATLVANVCVIECKYSACSSTGDFEALILFRIFASLETRPKQQQERTICHSIDEQRLVSLEF